MHVGRDNLAHGIEAHKRVRCSACHAQWSYQEYGLSVIREDRSEGYKWHRLTRQADPYLEQVMEAQLENPQGRPLSSKDWVTGDTRLGLWSIGWRFRRWEYLPLGIDPKGLYAVIRPRHQYLVSYVDRLGNVALDSVTPIRGDGSGVGWAFMPYVPHTISPAGRRCESCHLNPMAVGRGIFQEKTIDLSLMTPSKPPIGKMRLLTSAEQERLLKPSLQWKKARAQFFSYGIIPLSP
jgi:hypothetical protein